MARTISNEEIGLIKALLACGKRNRDIQFYFNKPDRPVNSGRISEIRKGKRGRDVPQATEGELAKFLEGVQSASDEGNGHAGSLTLAERSMAKFERKENGNWYLREGETTQQECKQFFDPKKLSPIIKAIAALANHKGGFIFLGVVDKQFLAEGLKDDTFDNTDIAQISDNVKNYLIPTPVFTKTCIKLGSVRVGVVYVERAEIRPIIVCKDGGGLEKGSILFRYPGQSAKIGVGDLITLLQERDVECNLKFVKAAQQTAAIDPRNRVLIDIAAGALESEGSSIPIDRKLIEQLKVIKQGEFDEIEGAPTLRVVSDVSVVDPVDPSLKVVERRNLSADHVLLAFLKRETVREPLEYVCASAFAQRQYLPIFYFAFLSEQPMNQVRDILNAAGETHSNSKAKALARLMGEHTAFNVAGGRPGQALKLIVAGQVEALERQFDDRSIAFALQGLPDDFQDLDKIFGLLDRMFSRASDDRSLKGIVFRAAARLDELAYRKSAWHSSASGVN